MTVAPAVNMKRHQLPASDAIRGSQDMRIETSKLYPIADWAQLPGRPFYAPRHRGQLTGEFRAPKAGEWFLSGAIPEAYYAPNALTTSYHILKIVRVKELLLVVPTERHHA